DREDARAVGEGLKERGILPWLDEWELRPGFPWQRVVEEMIKNGKAAVVLVSGNGVSPWQNLEVEALIREFAKRGCPVIPTILPDFAGDPRLTLGPFIGGHTWVDFRRLVPDPWKQLVFGITGQPL